MLVLYHLYLLVLSIFNGELEKTAADLLPLDSTVTGYWGQDSQLRPLLQRPGRAFAHAFMMG